jgi:hypothetical protein
MYVKVPEIVSYAQRELITLIENREYTGAMRKKYGVSDSWISSIYRAAVGKVKATYGMIYLLREQIEPVRWYYDENEGLPEKVEFRPKYRGYDLEMMNNFKNKATAAQRWFEEAGKKRIIHEICEENNISYSRLKNSIYPKRVHSEVAVYRQRPGYGIIKALRGVINPDYWYIFPDELPDD